MAAAKRSGERLDVVDADTGANLIAARGGSVEALGRLFESVRGHLRLAAVRGMPHRFRGRLGVSDVVQDAFVIGHRQFHAFRGGSRAEFFGWMRTILSHTLIDTVRRESAARRMAARPPQRLSAVGSNDDALADSPLGRPVPSAIRGEDADLIASALDSLPADQRRVIWLRHWKGLSFREIGIDVGRTEDATRMLWCRAFERLERDVRGRRGDSPDRALDKQD